MYFIGDASNIAPVSPQLSRVFCVSCYYIERNLLLVIFSLSFEELGYQKKKIGLNSERQFFLQLRVTYVPIEIPVAHAKDSQRHYKLFDKQRGNEPVSGLGI